MIYADTERLAAERRANIERKAQAAIDGAKTALLISAVSNAVRLLRADAKLGEQVRSEHITDGRHAHELPDASTIDYPASIVVSGVNWQHCQRTASLGEPMRLLGEVAIEVRSQSQDQILRLFEIEGETQQVPFSHTSGFRYLATERKRDSAMIAALRGASHTRHGFRWDHWTWGGWRGHDDCRKTDHKATAEEGETVKAGYFTSTARFMFLLPWEPPSEPKPQPQPVAPPLPWNHPLW